MFGKMTIRLRLGLMMAGIGALAVIVGVTGLTGMQHANTRVPGAYAVQLASQHEHTVLSTLTTSLLLGGILAVAAFRKQTGTQPNVLPTVPVAGRVTARVTAPVAARPAPKSKAVPRRAATLNATAPTTTEPVAQTAATPAVRACAKEQQRERTAAAVTKAAVSAPKLPVPTRVAAGGNHRDWETF
jgi:methyl-accepting chemotaxis protein-1 (serine sensor receptor)